jgi:hypothetical protein
MQIAVTITFLLFISQVSGNNAADVDLTSGEDLRQQPLTRRSHIRVKVPVSYTYVVGIEGVGHHGVTPALAVIAKSCGHHIEYQPQFLRHAHGRAQSHSYSAYIASMVTWGKERTLGADKIAVLEDQSFPMDNLKRNSTEEMKKATVKYNVEWLYDQTVKTGASIRFLHLTRDFYRTVASHADFDGGFENHALVLKSFQEHIHSEYEIIEARQPGLWRQIHYEWFTDMRNCTALASAIIGFAGWDNCDVDFACELLHKTLRNSTKRSTNETDYAFAQSLNASIPIPDLDISDSRVYPFTRVVSPRNEGHYSGELRSAQGLTYKPARNTTVPRRQRKAPLPSHDHSNLGDAGIGVVVTSTVGHGAHLQRTSPPHIPPGGQRAHSAAVPPLQEPRPIANNFPPGLSPHVPPSSVLLGQSAHTGPATASPNNPTTVYLRVTSRREVPHEQRLGAVFGHNAPDGLTLRVAHSLAPSDQKQQSVPANRQSSAASNSDEFGRQNLRGARDGTEISDRRVRAVPGNVAALSRHPDMLPHNFPPPDQNREYMRVPTRRDPRNQRYGPMAGA